MRRGDHHFQPRRQITCVLQIADDFIRRLMRSALPGVDHQAMHKAFKGAEILYTLRLPGGGKVLSLFPSHADHGIGERVGIRVQADHLIAFPKQEDGELATVRSN